MRYENETCAPPRRFDCRLLAYVLRDLRLPDGLWPDWLLLEQLLLTPVVVG